MFTIKSKIPSWLGRMPFIFLIDKFLALDFANDLLHDLSNFGNSKEATDHLLKQSNLVNRIRVEGLDQIPTGCPLLVVSNHPRGIGDGLVLLFCLSRIRPDLKFVVNELLNEIPFFNKVFISRANDGNKKNFLTVRRLLSHLRKDGCICLFPAGTVEHFDWQSLKIRESPWKMNFHKMAQMTGAVVVNAKISSRNSFVFHFLASFNRSSRTLLLIREFKAFMRQKNQRIDVTFNSFNEKNHGTPR